MLRKVLKRIPLGGDKYLESGTIVDVTKWRNARTLESNRYLGTVTEDEAQAWTSAQSKSAPATKAKSKPAKADEPAEDVAPVE